MAGNPTDRLILLYANGQRAYELALHIVPVDTTPSGPDGDYPYLPGGPKTPLESGVLATFAAFGALWAPYYDPAWVLSLQGVWHATGSDTAMLPAVPAAPDVLGTAPAAPALDPPLRRGFSFRSALGNNERVRFFEPAGNQAGRARIATAASGGFDSRDRMLVAYLSGLATGLMCWDGLPFPPSARVYVRFQHLRSMAATAPMLGDYLVNG